MTNTTLGFDIRRHSHMLLTSAEDAPTFSFLFGHFDPIILLFFLYFCCWAADLLCKIYAYER